MLVIPLVPLLTPVSVVLLPILMNLFWRKRSAAKAALGAYRASMGLKSIYLILTVMITIGPIASYLSARNKEKWLGSVPVLHIEIIIFIYAVISIALWVSMAWIINYSVRLTDEALDVSAFSTQSVRYADITRLRLEQRSRASILIIEYGRSGKLQINASMQQFADMYAKLQERVKQAGGGHGGTFV